MGFINKEEWTLSNLIQLGVFVGILVTCIFTYCNIRQQGEFNRNAFRPWIYVEPRKNIEVMDGRIIFWYNLKCDGESPGYNVVRYEAITFDSIFPIKKFKELKRDRTKKLEKIGLIAPRTTKYLDDHRIIDFGDRTSKDSLIQKIVGRSLFAHIYVEYSDFKNNLYCFSCTYLPKGLKEYATDQYDCEWFMIDALEECIK
jgi:hypothetical protein